MNLYLYISKNIMFDYLSRNIIAPDSVVEDKKGIKTISTRSRDLLFVTHKKLNRKIREEGITDSFICPITIEISDVSDKDGEAILIHQKDGNVEYRLAKLSEYNTEINVGAYVIGEIPFSRVNRILFDSNDDIDMFNRPSDDYWYPSDKFGILNEKEFTDDFTIVIDEEKALSDCGLNANDIFHGIVKREKQRAAILDFVDATRKWVYGKYEFSIDSKLQEWLDLKDEELNTSMCHYLEMKDKKDNIEDIALIDKIPEKADTNQVLFDSIVEKLIEVPFLSTKNPEVVLDILDGLVEYAKSKCIECPEKEKIELALDDIYGFISSESDKSIEDIITSIDDSIDILKALLFIFKNPGDYKIFLQSLVSYGVDVLTIRRSAVLWGYLNALYGMPGENYNKDNQKLWKYIEAYVREKEQIIIPTLYVEKEKPVLNEKDNTILGLELKEEEIITAEEVYEVLLNTDDNLLGSMFYDRLLEVAINDCGSKKNAEKRGYLYCIASSDLHEIKMGDILDSSIEKAIKIFVADLKNPKANKEKLRKDYVEDFNKFNNLFANDKKYWKDLFKKIKR